CAIRGLLSSLPPTIVSRKCVCHESSGETCVSAAATPPSAMTVCALPRSDLQTSPTSAPAAFASIAARSPAPPAPMTSTSCGRTSGSLDGTNAVNVTIGWTLEVDRRVGDDAEGEEPHVDVGERHGQEARPRPGHVVEVQPGQPLPHRVADLAPARARE